MEKRAKQLKSTTIGLMIAVALFYDALSWLLAFIFMSWAVIPLFYLTFWMWFKMHGISFFNRKRAPTQLFGFALEALTAGIIPGMTFVVARIALDSKIKAIAKGEETEPVENKKAA